MRFPLPSLLPCLLALLPCLVRLSCWCTTLSRSRNSGGLRRKRIRSRSPCRRIGTVLARLRLGHTNVTHVYLMQGQTEPPECDRCRVTITVKHLLLECRKYVTIHNKYFRNPTLSDMLAESNDFSIDKLVLHLKEANLFHQI